MTVYVFARRKQDADRWAHEQGYYPREVLTYGGHQSPWGGIRFRDGDRVVILEPVARELRLMVQRLHHNSVQNRRPPIETFNLTVEPAPPR